MAPEGKEGKSNHMVNPLATKHHETLLRYAETPSHGPVLAQNRGHRPEWMASINKRPRN